MNADNQPHQSAENRPNNDIKENTQKKSYPCPHCQTPIQWHNNPYKPFCSERCKLIDFGAWANEEYRVPITETY